LRDRLLLKFVSAGDNASLGGLPALASSARIDKLQILPWWGLKKHFIFRRNVGTICCTDALINVWVDIPLPRQF